MEKQYATEKAKERESERASERKIFFLFELCWIAV